MLRQSTIRTVLRKLLSVAKKCPVPAGLNQISHIHGHFINLCAVVLLNIPQYPNVITPHKIDGHTLHKKMKNPHLVSRTAREC
jgi:hypothetical protein